MLSGEKILDYVFLKPPSLEHDRYVLTHVRNIAVLSDLR